MPACSFPRLRGKVGMGAGTEGGGHPLPRPLCPHPSPPPQAGEGVVCPFPPADGVVCRSPRAVEGVVCPLLYAGRGHLLLPPFTGEGWDGGRDRRRGGIHCRARVRRPPAPPRPRPGRGGGPPPRRGGGGRPRPAGLG